MHLSRHTRAGAADLTLAELAHDAHGNTTKFTDQTLVFDKSNRHLSTTVDEWNGQPRNNILVEAGYRNPANLGVIRAQIEEALEVAVFNVPSLGQQLDGHQWSMLDPDWNLEAARPSNPG